MGVLRSEGDQVCPHLNPPDGFVVDKNDRIVFIAQSYQDTEPVPDYTPQPTGRGLHSGSPEVTTRRRILLMGWNEKVPALVSEFDSYENETFEVDVLSSIPVKERIKR